MVNLNIIYLEQQLGPYSMKVPSTSSFKFASVSEARFTCHKAFLHQCNCSSAPACIPCRISRLYCMQKDHHLRGSSNKLPVRKRARRWRRPTTKKGMVTFKANLHICWHRLWRWVLLTSSCDGSLLTCGLTSGTGFGLPGNSKPKAQGRQFCFLSSFLFLLYCTWFVVCLWETYLTFFICILLREAHWDNGENESRRQRRAQSC